MSRRLSMSRIGLAHQCSYWARDDVSFQEKPSGRAARVGTLVHLLAESHVTGRSVAMDDVDLHELAEAKAIMDGPFKGWLDRHRWEACEIGLRFDAENDTAEDGPRRGEPGYEDHGPMVLKGTLDLVGLGDDVIWVVDIKTGQKQHTNPEQLYSQSAAAARRFNVSRAHVGFVFPRKTKCDEPQYETLDADRLDEEAGRIRRTLRLLPTSEPQPGDHCWKCPLGRAACPAYERSTPDWAPILSDEALAF